MATINIDGTEYDIDNFSDDAKAQLASIQYVDSELTRVNALAAALQTSRIAYGNALKELLPKEDAGAAKH